MVVNAVNTFRNFESEGSPSGSQSRSIGLAPQVSVWDSGMLARRAQLGSRHAGQRIGDLLRLTFRWARASNKVPMASETLESPW